MTIGQHAVAVVDDDAGVLKALGRLLKAYGYRVELFASAAEALRAAPASQAKCLVIDCQLGDACGVELGRKLSAMGCRIPIIFITGSEDDSIRRDAIDFGCVAYLKKPLLGDELLASIAKATRRLQVVTSE